MCSVYDARVVVVDVVVVRLPTWCRCGRFLGHSKPVNMELLKRDSSTRLHWIGLGLGLQGRKQGGLGGALA